MDCSKKTSDSSVPPKVHVLHPDLLLQDTNEAITRPQKLGPLPVPKPEKPTLLDEYFDHVR
jgi:hypothetical protein